MLDYRCMVSGSEQKFLLGLGVSAENSPRSFAGSLQCYSSAFQFHPILSYLQRLEGITIPETAGYFVFLLSSLINPGFVVAPDTEAYTLAVVSIISSVLLMVFHFCCFIWL